ncbi:hypothetical protein [uncultured Desulfuromonas sp.]|uniref:hypothetical protein n=1 Tax=uncultured Desulfuromonas sp. TaxID=181013 RepID=UPI002AAB341F|nr:hypothetical protein [uncultured Desulfuromonas sp.]
MAFERFERPGERVSKKISVWKQGVIHLSKGTINAFALNGLDFCSLYYDRDTKRVGLQFLGSAELCGTVKLSYRDVGAVIPAKSFFDCYQISYNPSRQYFLDRDVESGLLFFDLGAPVADGYVEHPDGRWVEDAFMTLSDFIEERQWALSPQDSAVVGRYLFESGVYFNWSAFEMRKCLEEMAHVARTAMTHEPFDIPLGKKVFEILQHGLNQK